MDAFSYLSVLLSIIVGLAITQILAGFRGFLLDLCATRERRRVNRAVELWLQMLDSASSTEIAS